MRYRLDPLSSNGLSPEPEQQVKQSNGYVAKVQRLNELQDVTISGTPSDNQALAYDTASGKWIPQTISGSGGGTWGSITGTLSDQTDLQTALDGKESTLTAGTTAQYYRGDKSWQTLDKTAVGLGNVDNTSDANKPISTATQTALDGKARLEGGDALFNQANGAYDFKVGGNTLDNMIHVRKSFDRVGIGVQPDRMFHVGGDSQFDDDVTITGGVYASTGYAGGSGGSIDSTKIVNIDNTVAEGGDRYGLFVTERFGATANNANVAFGGFVQAQTVSGNTFNYTGGLRGMKVFAEHNGTGTVSNAFGAEFQVRNNSTGTVSSAIGLNIGAADNGGGGTVTTAIGLQIGDQSNGSTGYGVYLLAGGVKNAINWAGDTNLYRSAANIVATDDDVEITDNTKGIILKSPNGSRWRVTVDNTGALTTTAL